MGSVLQDLRYGLRTILKDPGFALVAILTLALGIGANSTLFSVVDGILLRPLPFPDPGRLVALWENVPEKGWNQEPLSYPDFADWEARALSWVREPAPSL